MRETTKQSIKPPVESPISTANAYISGLSAINTHSNSSFSNTKKSALLVNKQGLLSTLAVIDADSNHPKISTTNHLRSQYHKELLKGLTGGMILVGFCQMTSNSLNGSLTVAQRSALVRLIDYVKDWGSLLNGMNIKPIPPVEHRSDIEARMFYKGRRRYILIVNTLEDRYARGSVIFAAESFEGLVTRAIEISTMGAHSLGRVFNMRKNRLILPVTLRPGDAALFELF